MAFATSADLAAYLQATVDSTTADLLLDLASDAIRAATGLTVDEVVADVVTVPAPSGVWLTLPEWPAAAPTEVRVDGGIITDWYADVPADPASRTRLYRAAGWEAVDAATGAPLRVQITYTHGYAAIPGEVKRVCLQAAARAYRNPAGLRSETIGSESYTYATPSNGVAADVTLTDQERRDVRRALGVSSASSVALG